MGKALVMASQDGNVMNMCRLINQGADVDHVHRWMHEGLERSATPLIQATLDGHADAARVLISRNADVNKPEPCHGLTALHSSADGGCVPLMQLLISKGAKIDARSKKGLTPLHQAACCGHKEAAICLLDHGADINAADDKGFTPLQMTVDQEKRLPLVDLFLIRGADPNLATNHLSPTEGRTALHASSIKGRFEIAECLAEGGANVDQVDKNGSSPLHFSAHEGHLQIVKLLVKKGANIHLVNIHGATALHAATFKGHREIVDYLIKKGADFDDQGNAVVRVCKYCGATDVPTMQKCSECRVVWYCNPECQKKDWREGGENKHKLQCPRIKEQRDLYKDRKKEEAKDEAEEINERLNSTQHL